MNNYVFAPIATVLIGASSAFAVPASVAPVAEPVQAAAASDTQVAYRGPWRAYRNIRQDFRQIDRRWDRRSRYWDNRVDRFDNRFRRDVRQWRRRW